LQRSLSSLKIIDEKYSKVDSRLYLQSAMSTKEFRMLLFIAGIITGLVFGAIGTVVALRWPERRAARTSGPQSTFDYIQRRPK
jgi:hypothetical protein